VPFKSFVAKMCLAAALFATSQAQAQYILVLLCYKQTF
jgi:hypothetical protein